MVVRVSANNHPLQQKPNPNKQILLSFLDCPLPASGAPGMTRLTTHDNPRE
jgi:hypothetical protein